VLGLIVLAAALSAPVDPIVHVMIHVPLSVTHLAAYQTDLRRYGHLTDHVGTGTWTNSRDPAAPIVSERVDHIELTTDLRTARTFLVTFLRLLRIEQHQQETLGEIFGGNYGTPQQMRTRIIVRLASGAATPARLDRLHRIFANNGDGGDSCYAERSVVVDYSGVLRRDAARIEAALTRDRFAYATEEETFVTDDAATP
jgi:hypothetical protein